MKFFLLFLTITGFLNASGTTDAEMQEKQKLTVVSPERLLTPERGYIANEYFTFVYIRPDFAAAMASIFADSEIMKYMCAGETKNALTVKEETEWKTENQEREGYFWAVINCDGICGVTFAYLTETDGVLEVARIFSRTMQGKKQGRALFDTMFSYLPDASWKVTSHPKNIASWKSQESADFIYQKTEYVEDYQGDRKFYARPSNTELEGREKFRFSYSGKVCSFAELMTEN
jgi:hypothetical protein